MASEYWVICLLSLFDVSQSDPGFDQAGGAYKAFPASLGYTELDRLTDDNLNIHCGLFPYYDVCISFLLL